ncbi:hypothetical protein BC826DRAFT_265262 [Russula brevipes]|nr:hypothetical protein BC826DRAFT_265262 [Russula brevipes]
MCSHRGIRHRFSLCDCAQRVVVVRPFSPRTIITTVNATISCVFFKAQRVWGDLCIRGQTRHDLSPHPTDPAEVSGSPSGGFVRHMTIQMLPDDILLEIFDHHRLAAPDYSLFEPWGWHRLAHVCQRWRSVIFASPRRLNLRLVYTYRKPARKTLDCWPPLPISIWYPRMVLYQPLYPADEENVIAALKYPDRICEINLTLTRPLLEKLTPLMQDPFPVLEYLQLGSRDMMEMVLPSTFLGGFTPRLRRIDLNGTPFPTLPQLLLSATNLVSLRLHEVPSTGYFSPEALVTGLDATPKLEVLEIYFLHPTSSHVQGSPPLHSQVRAALPKLTELHFTGDNGYLESLVARIDAPSVEQFGIKLFDQRAFELSQLAEFIGLTEELKSSSYRTSVWLWEYGLSITHFFGRSSQRGTFRLQLSCAELSRQVPLLISVCGQLSLLVSSVEHLDIEVDQVLSDLWDETDTAQWLELLTLFSNVRRLELIGALVSSIASVLEQFAGNQGRDFTVVT